MYLSISILSVFCRQLLLLSVLHEMVLGLFRFRASLGRNMIISQTFGIVFVLGEFVISRENVPSWWIWAYWCSPMSYGQNALAVNEFLAPRRWNKPSGTTSNETLRRAIIEARGLFAEARFYWIAFGKSQGILSKDVIEEKHANRTGESSHGGELRSLSVDASGKHSRASAQPVVDVERNVFYRERAAGMYSAFSYAFGQVAIEVPYVLVQSVVYTRLVYSMIAFEWTAVKFFCFLFFMYLTFLYFTFFGMVTVAMTPNFHVAAIIAAAFYSTWNLFCGFIIPRPKMPVWWRWYNWVTPVSWTFYGLVASQLADVDTEMVTADEKVMVSEFIRNYFGMRHDFLGIVA